MGEGGRSNGTTRSKGSHFINELKGWWVSCFIFLIHPFYVQRDSYPHSPSPLRLVVFHVAVMLLLFTTERLMLIFALPWLSVLLVVVVYIVSSCSPFPLCSSIVSIVTCNKWFHAFFFFFLNIHFEPSPPSPSLSPFLLLSLLFLNACDVCIGLFWCDQSSTPKFTCKIKTSAHTKTLHHDWLLPPGDDLPCPLPPPVCPPPGLSCPALPCPDWRLLLRALSVIGCADGERVVHQNMGFLLTGTTSVRSVSTKSRAKVFPWEMIPPSPRRKYCLKWFFFKKSFVNLCHLIAFFKPVCFCFLYI